MVCHTIKQKITLIEQATHDGAMRKLYDDCNVRSITGRKGENTVAADRAITGMGERMLVENRPL